MEEETERKMDLAPLDALIKVIQEAPSRGYAFNSNHLGDVVLLRALIMDPPQEIIEKGSLKELESVASHVGSLFSSFNLPIRSSLVAAELNQQLKRALDPMRDWRLSYALLPDESSVTEKDILDLDHLLLKTLRSPFMSSTKRVAQDLEIFRAGFADFRRIFRKQFISLKRELRSISDLHKSQRNNKERDQRFYMRFIETFHAKGYVYLFDYYRNEVKTLKPSVIYFPKTGRLDFVDRLVENLETLVKEKADSIGTLKPYISEVHKMLQSLSSHFMELPEPRKKDAHLKDRLKRITDMAYEVEFAIDSFLVKDIPIWFCIFWFRDILKQGEFIMREVRMDFGHTLAIVKSIKDSAPKELTIIPVVNEIDISGKLWKVFNHPSISTGFKIRTKCLVSSYKERKKEVFHELLRNASYNKEGDLKEHERKLLKEAYARNMQEDELKESLRKLLKNKRYFIILEDVQDIEALNDIIRVLPHNFKKSRVMLTTPSAELAIQCRYGSSKVLFNKNSKDNSSTSQTNKPVTHEDVVGFKVETEGMLDHLLGEPKQLRIISIAGMGGQGKTTLAKKLYNHPSILNRFTVRAWCRISQVYKKKELLIELLGQVVQLPDKIHHKNDAELAHMLWKSFTGRRFLVVLDDIWNTEAWDDLKRCFPNDNNGSRIIFTTRLQHLALQAESSSMLQPLGLLSIDDSLELLRKKVSCPPELLGIARHIAERCKGLPISIMLIAGLLTKIEKREDQWKKVAESLSSQILGVGKKLGEAVIELSYKHLPDHLKSCFLYLGAFLMDKEEVSVSKLIRLWVAEGFIKHVGLENLEDLAEAYLMDLISRSLVTVGQTKSNNGVKSCLIHDLVRDFCLTKPREENFLELIHGYDKYFPSSSNDMDYGIDPNYSCSSEPIRYSLRRLCISSKRNHFIMLKPLGPFVRSLLFFVANDMCPNFSYDISFISHNFKLLRILDLEDINIGDSFKAIEVLIHLRYLAIQGYVDFVPSSIANLWNLETFLVRGLRAKVVKVSNSIWDMTKLRNVHINDTVSFDLDPLKLENSSKLNNLQSFSTPSLSYGDDMEKIMRKIMPEIQKLKCKFLDSLDDIENRNQFPDLEFLSKLVSLKVLYNGDGKYPCKFRLP